MDLLGSFLRKLRKEKDLPIRKVAAEIDVDQSTWGKYERGERIPPKEVLPNIAAYYGIDEKELRRNWLSERVLEPIKDEVEPEEILEIAKDKLKIVVTQKQKQGSLDF